MITDHSVWFSKLSELFLIKSETTSIQFFRYLFVGGFAALVDFGFFMLMGVVFHQHYLVAQTFGFITGITTNYMLSTVWIFRSRYARLTESGLFLVTGLIGLLLSYFLLWLLIDILEITWYENALAKLLTIFLVLIWNFSSRKWFVFQ